ncbi:hypothetical protein [Alteromonas sp. P256]|uniref:hypothetical protein n=1 Tax=Alteromonas sp. P256 TaxID=3117399 RepID=UPI002FE224CC
MGTVVVDTGLQTRKSDLNRVLSSIFKEPISENTRKHRAKLLLFSSITAYLLFAGVQLTQVGWLKFESTSTSPTTPLVLIATYYLVYFVKFAHSDFAKYKIARSFDIFDKYERGIETLARKIENSEGITSNEFTNNELTNWLADYKADRETLIESSNRTFRELILLEYGVPVATHLVALGLYLVEVIIPSIQPW